MKQPKTREEEAGEMWREAAGEISRGAHNIRMLALHISQMLRGIEAFPGPMWQRRIIPPEGKLVVLEKFEDYLLLPQRDGLHFKSLFQVHRFLEGADKYGAEALALIRTEIPGWDAKVEIERVKATGKAAPKLSEHGANQHGEKSGCDIGTSSRGTNSAAYLAARIKRDRPDIAEQVERGEFKSMRSAAKAAGIIRDKSRLERIQAIFNSASNEEKDEICEWIADQ